MAGSTEAEAMAKEQNPLNPETKKQQGKKKVRLASALRENLKRRKAAPRPAKKGETDGGT